MIESIMNIPVLFFVFGALAVFLKSDLEMQKSMTDGIVLYLMMAIGIKGGINLAGEPVTWSAWQGGAQYALVNGGFIPLLLYCARGVRSRGQAGLAAVINVMVLVDP